MAVNPYARPLLRIVTDLVNRPPADVEDLQARWAAHRMPIGRPAEAADLRAVRRYLRGWRQVVDARPDLDRVEALNVLLRRYTTPAWITAHDGSGWHLHHRAPDAGFAAVLAGSTTVAAAQYLTEHGMGRLGRCALADCRAAFVDFSRPGRQRYCGHPCANRDAVRRHRAARPAVLR